MPSGRPSPGADGLVYLAGALPDAFERQVTATPVEFERDLRRAWPAGVDVVAPAHFRLHDGDVCLDIQTEPRPMRRLGLFELPQLAARYRFSGGDEESRRKLLATLDRAMQRGGG